MIKTPNLPDLWLQWCVLLPVVLTLISNQSKDGGISKLVAKYIYPTWALEAFVLANAERFLAFPF